MRHLLLTAALLAFPTLASAQALPDIQDALIQEGKVTAAAGQTAKTGETTGPAPDVVIDGEAGVYLLKVNEIFQVSAAGSIGYSENPQRVLGNPGDSFYKDYALSAAVVTRLAAQVDFAAALSLTGRDFIEDYGPSGRNIAATVSVGMPIDGGPVYVGLVGFTGESYDQDFDDGIRFKGIAANVSTVFPIGDRWAVRPGAGITRQWSEVSENNSLTYNLSADVFYAISPKITAALQVGVSKRVYDNFYEDVTFIERKDNTKSVGVSVAYKATPYVTLALNAGYEKQESSFFLAEFESTDASINLVLRRSF